MYYGMCYVRTHTRLAPAMPGLPSAPGGRLRNDAQRLCLALAVHDPDQAVIPTLFLDDMAVACGATVRLRSWHASAPGIRPKPAPPSMIKHHPHATQTQYSWRCTRRQHCPEAARTHPIHGSCWGLLQPPLETISHANSSIVSHHFSLLSVTIGLNVLCCVIHATARPSSSQTKLSPKVLPSPPAFVLNYLRCHLLASLSFWKNLNEKSRPLSAPTSSNHK
ncbi:hypothetical protein T440DRAFT_299763 [Plenodomus tracheiphilus IPT5]|uniref:Uncharacterized protein n=1 Tax=Plenodomus tracheiphilus IPT5 TaxID=1408161 RepID=A0A6A7ANQ2_9PLEO|nr:hypothetical protein T440DRAFT_299763 [Plenodomus tracheiphilus IPT5]